MHVAIWNTGYSRNILSYANPRNYFSYLGIFTNCKKPQQPYMKVMKMNNTEHEVFVILFLFHTSITHKLLLERKSDSQVSAKIYFARTVGFSHRWLTITLYFFTHQYFSTPGTKVHAGKNLTKAKKKKKNQQINRSDNSNLIQNKISPHQLWEFGKLIYSQNKQN